MVRIRRFRKPSKSDHCSAYKDGRYVFPNDDVRTLRPLLVTRSLTMTCTARSRSARYTVASHRHEIHIDMAVDLQHHMLGLTYGCLALAPIHKPKTALDIGTGTGIWAIEFGSSIRVATAHHG